MAARLPGSDGAQSMLKTVLVSAALSSLTPAILATATLPANLASIDLKIEGAGPITRCLYRVGAGEFTQLGQELQSSFLSTDTAGGFQGVTLGLFAHN